MNKKDARIKRAMRTRKKLYKLDAIRLVVHRTCRHIYAQIISKDNSNVLVAASTTEKLISSQLTVTSNKKAAAIVGKIIAERAIKKGIINVSFDRSGFKYHGRVKTLADCARQTGLSF
ncbi:50S ribosomal protein L18 [Blochmannia endosymbiont of Camponotus sp.]|uniref:50S ribosomal protein L18 n=1 Tax=Blochmannia endosymbiont of Camponotus sp. TaxID=700220 RepID=UPI002023D198|nr:50S ribosomal protein L18 [Blochmannia endosymbiont of Camponotus sp.]URJ32676.1 50S ribosomal protein L18 [Blochmannia endosymbiont of Camponotus sp.]